jgi:integrase
MATYWLTNGVPVKVGSERLGHSSIAITLRVYGHVLSHMQSEAAEKMDVTILGTARTVDLPHKVGNSLDKH